MIAITGYPLFAKRIANALQKQGIYAKYYRQGISGKRLGKIFKTCSLVHFIGSPTVTRHFLELILCRLWNKKIVVSWIGYDVRYCKYNKFRKALAKTGNMLVDRNLAVSKNLVEDLGAIGVEANLQPIPVYSIYQIRELPVVDRVAVYLPARSSSNASWKFYQGDIIKKLVKEFQDVEFLILKNNCNDFVERNAKCFAWVNNMEEIYQQVKVVIRLPIEDGTSGTIIETLSMGRNMICSNTLLPFCYVVNSYQEVRSALIYVLKKSKLNVEGSKFAHKNFGNSKLAYDLIRIYNSLS